MTNSQLDTTPLRRDWESNPRWNGIRRAYTHEDVLRLRGSLQVQHTLATRGSMRFWESLNKEPFIKALGALSGNQAVQQVQAGLKAIYVSGWQVAADANTAGQMYPDQSLYPADSVPHLVKRINASLQRADQIRWMSGDTHIDWFAPIIADAEAGFGGTLNAFEITKSLIEAGAAAMHLEDQLASMKKCGHMGGKVVVPASEFIAKLQAARLASDIQGVPLVLIARTDALSAKLLSSDADPGDQPFINGSRTSDGMFPVKSGLEYAISRGIAYAPHADLVWFETSTPDIGEAREFAQALHVHFPEKLLAYNCSPSFNWNKHLDKSAIGRFQEELALMGYKFQFVTLAGFHALNAGMFELARAYRSDGMSAYARFQEHEFDLERRFGFSATKHQSFVGTGYFDEVQLILSAGESQTTALKGSTEEEQFV